MKSRKILVPIDLDKPDKVINEVLYPKKNNDSFSLTTTKNHKRYEYGMVILKGGGITENDLFAQIVDSGIKIDSVESLLKNLEDYLEKINLFKIGNILKIESLNNGNDFDLKKHLNRISLMKANKIP